MYTRANLLRDALVFQAKLVLDGFRDVLLFPVSVAAVVFDLVGRDDAPGRHFRQVLAFGRRTEHWIGLFSAAQRFAPESKAGPAPHSDASMDVDALVDEMERLIRREYQREGGPGSVREIMDRAWKRIESRRRAARRKRDRDLE